MLRARLAALLPLLHVVAMAAEIVLPAPDLERDQAVTAVYRTAGLATGKGALDITWSDALGRVVELRTISVELTDESEIRFPLDLRRSVAMENTLAAHFTFEGVNRKGEPDRRDEKTQTNFIARPSARDWRDYRIVMWQQYPADQWNTLKSMGINAGQYVGRNQPPPEFLAGSDLLWYAENIATDFYSEYHRYFSDCPVDWKFSAAKELYRKDPYEPALFAFLPVSVEGVRLAIPTSVALGSIANISFSVDSPAATSVFHVDVMDPAGKTAAHYSGNFFGLDGRGGIEIPFAVNDSAGKWEVRVRDLLTGNTARSAIEVRPYAREKSSNE